MPSKQQQDTDNCRTAQTHNVQKHISRVVSEMGRVDDETKYLVPTYVLTNMEKSDVNLDVRESSAVSLPSMLNKSNCSTNCERILVPTPCKRSQTSGTRGSSQQQFVSHYIKTNVDSSTCSVRNKSMKCIPAPDLTTRQGIRPSQTSSATTSTSRTPVARPTNHRLQRKIHGGDVVRTEPQKKGIQTYSVKKPLHYKPGCETTRCQSPLAVRNLPESSPSFDPDSLATHMSDSRLSLSCDYAENDNDVTQPSYSKPSQHIVLSGTANKTASKAKSAALSRAPVTKPSARKLNGMRAAVGLRLDHRLPQTSRADNGAIFQQLQQSHVNLQPYSGCMESTKDDVQTDGRVAQVTAYGTVLSHLSPTEHSFIARDDTHCCTTEQQQQQLFNCPASTTADYQTRHVQIARKPADNDDERHQQQHQRSMGERKEQTAEPVPSASQESVANGQPAHKKTPVPVPPSTLSMCTVGTDVRPVSAAPSGLVAHRRISKIPRPKLGLPSARPSVSATSTISRCSFTSIRSEFNCARPLPVERIPFSKFGLEYIMPLARQEVSVIAIEAFSITGVSGQRKRFLPLVKSIAENLWERVQDRMNPLSVETAQLDAGQDACRPNVSVISSTVARPVAHAATQTRKSLSLKQQKKSRLPRKEKAEKHEEGNADYSGMLVRLVQLLYLQTKLNACKADERKSATNTEATANPFSAVATPTLQIDYLQKQQRQRHVAPPNLITARPTYAPQSSNQGARVYRAGSSVTQVYAKNPSSAQVSSDRSESTHGPNNWANGTSQRTVHFDQAQSDMAPWRSYHQSPTTTAFTPSQRFHDYDKRFWKTSPYPGSSNMMR